MNIENFFKAVQVVKAIALKEGLQLSKMKFKIDCVMKGGGVSLAVKVWGLYFFPKMFFFNPIFGI